MRFNIHYRITPLLAFWAILTSLLGGCSSNGGSFLSTAKIEPTVTPIKHVVVIFQENVSFDHYFGTYPHAINPPGEPVFTASVLTPTSINTLATPLDVTNNFRTLTGVDLINNNPTKNNKANGTNAINPFRLDRTQAATADQDHNYDAEQKSFNAGAMDLFPSTVGIKNTAAPQGLTPPLNTPGVVMGYYDGNTVTALWNYAQNFAMNDNSYNTTFGPSSPGAINLISGQTNGVIASNGSAKISLSGELSSDANGGIVLTGDAQPLGDVCSTRAAVTLGGKNIGDLLNTANVSWGFFQGGFDLTVTNPNGTTGCHRSSVSRVTGQTKVDYIPHHQPFQYYTSTANLTHARPSAVKTIGQTYQADGKTPDPANHQYDIHDFFDAVSAGHYPAVNFLKAPGYQDGHAGYSSPLDEQTFITQIINFLQVQPDWANTVVIIAYDDSDGWYDHQASPIVNPSRLTATLANFTSNGVNFTGLGDWLNRPGACISGTQQGTNTPTSALAGPTGTANVQGRCGYGPRLPLLVISPYAKVNYVDHTLTDQTSILRFIEDNWLSGVRISGSFDSIAGPINNMLNFTTGGNSPRLYLDPASGQPKPCPNCN